MSTATTPFTLSHGKAVSPARMAAACLVLVGIVSASDIPRIVWQGWQLALLPHPTCMTEVYILDGMAAVAHGETLYPPQHGLPWVFHIYNSLTYLPGGLAGRALGLDFNGLLIAGRMLPFVCGLALPLLWAWHLRRSTSALWSALLVVTLAFYYHSSTLTDFFRARPETPGLLLTMAAWMTAQHRPRRWPILAALGCVLAIGFKQTFLAAPAAIALQLAAERNYRDLGRFLAACVALGLTLVWGSWALLGRGYFQHTVFAMQADPIRPLTASRFFYPILLREHWGLLAAALACALVWMSRRRAAWPLLLYLAACFLWTSTAHGKVGADVNYHGELSLLMVACVVWALADMVGNASPAALAPAALLCLSVVGSLGKYGPGWNQVCTNRAHPMPFGFSLAAPLDDAAPWVERYRSLAGRALIFDNEIGLRVGRPVVQDWLTLTLLLDAGRLNFNDLAEPVRRQAYAVIVFDQNGWDHWTRRLRETAEAAGYRVTLENDRLCELRPGDPR